MDVAGCLTKAQKMLNLTSPRDEELMVTDGDSPSPWLPPLGKTLGSKKEFKSRVHIGDRSRSVVHAPINMS